MFGAERHSTHCIYRTKDGRRRENAARAASRRCAHRAIGRRSQTVRKDNTSQLSHLDAFVQKAKRRVSAYKRKQAALQVNPRRPSRNGAVWYSHAVAKRLVARENGRSASEAAEKAERNRLIQLRLAALSESVGRIMRFGAFKPGSFILRNDNGRRVARTWIPSHVWRPGPYLNPLVASHQGPHLANARLFGAPPPVPSRLLKFAIQSLRKRSPSKFRSANPRWQLAAKGLRNKILADPNFIDKRKRDFKAQVERTRRFLRERELRRATNAHLPLEHAGHS